MALFGKLFTSRKELSDEQCANIRKAIDLLVQLMHCCPELGRDEERAQWLLVLQELASSDEEIRDNFGSNDDFLDGEDAQGYTAKALGVFWNRFILIHTDLNPDRPLDPDNCRDRARLLELAVTMWHEVGHWECSQDGWIQTEEVAFWKLLKECPCITESECAEEYAQAIHPEETSAESGAGWWEGLKNWVVEQLATITIGTLIGLIILAILALFVAAIKALAIGVIALIALAFGLALWFWWSVFTCFLPKVFDGIGTAWNAVTNGWNLSGSTSTTSGSSEVSGATTGVDTSNASGAPDGQTVTLTACQSVILRMPKAVADEHTFFGGLDDLRVTATGEQYEVEVANSPIGPWEACGEGAGAADFDVPWWGSPWAYVRVHALGNVQLDAVEDIDY